MGDATSEALESGSLEAGHRYQDPWTEREGVGSPIGLAMNQAGDFERYSTNQDRAPLVDAQASREIGGDHDAVLGQQVVQLGPGFELQLAVEGVAPRDRLQLDQLAPSWHAVRGGRHGDDGHHLLDPGLLDLGASSQVCVHRRR